jgi:hypothetical protein
MAGVAQPTPPVALEAAEWDQHLGLLRTTYPDWRFAAGIDEP